MTVTAASVQPCKPRNTDNPNRRHHRWTSLGHRRYGFAIAGAWHALRMHCQMRYSTPLTISGMPQQRVTLNMAVELNNGRSNQPHGCEALRCVGWLARSYNLRRGSRLTLMNTRANGSRNTRATTKRGGLWRYSLWLPEHRLVHDEPSHYIRGSRAYTRNEYARLCSEGMRWPGVRLQ